MTLSYFTGEQHCEKFEKIIHLAEELGYSVRVYESKESNQFDFLQAVYRDTATIVDATIPNDLTLSTVYPLLTEHVNILDHILVFSEKQYEDGSEVLPLNITPKRTMNKNEYLLEWLEKQLLELKEESLFDRFVIESPDVVVNYMKRMEEAIVKSLDKYEQKRGGKTRVMISYRNSCSEEVELFRKEEEAKEKVEIKVLPPGSLCGDYEAHTPMRRWMLTGLLDDHIREVDEVWVYYNDTYTNSWWTLAELVMVANINKDRSDDKKVKIKVYDAKEKRFLEEKDYPSFIDVKLTDEQHRRLARLLSNTRPDSMGPENLDNIVQLRQVVPILRVMTDEMREAFIENIRPMLEMGIPQTLPDDQRELMLQDMLKLYSDPDELERYVNDEVFQDVFWNNISYQTDVQSPAMKKGVVNPDAFMDAPMNEATRLSEEDLKAAVDKTIQLQSASGAKLYHVEKGITRYLWLATRMGMPTVKDAPGIEIVQTYNLLFLNSIGFIGTRKSRIIRQAINSRLKKIDSSVKIIEFEDDEYIPVFNGQLPQGAIDYINQQTNLLDKTSLIVSFVSDDFYVRGFCGRVEYTLGKHLRLPNIQIKIPESQVQSPTDDFIEEIMKTIISIYYT